MGQKAIHFTKPCDKSVNPAIRDIPMTLAFSQVGLWFWIKKLF